jgi:hypothetical protein
MIFLATLLSWNNVNVFFFSIIKRNSCVFYGKYKASWKFHFLCWNFRRCLFGLNLIINGVIFGFIFHLDCKIFCEFFLAEIVAIFMLIEGNFWFIVVTIRQFMSFQPLHHNLKKLTKNLYDNRKSVIHGD